MLKQQLVWRIAAMLKFLKAHMIFISSKLNFYLWIKIRYLDGLLICKMKVNSLLPLMLKRQEYESFIAEHTLHI